MSANAEMLGGAELSERVAQEAAAQVAIRGETEAWSPENFAREQIRGLVRRVFFSGAARPVRQVVFSAAGTNGDVANICDRVGRALALETSADIAIVGRWPGEEKMMRGPRIVANATIKSCSIKSWSIQTATNVWHVPELEVSDCGEGSRCGRYWLSCLAELRNEFEYAVIQGPAAGISSEAALLGELADGIILVLGANSTRKAAARKIKNTLEGSRSRILGTVLRERTFPIPEQIYRRL
jgi:hypothetical protein